MDEQPRTLATDGVVLIDGDVVMFERNRSPEEGAWVLPGGVVERDETAAAACVREVHEEVGLSVEPVAFAGLFDDPDRDPRGNVSAAYLCVPTDDAPPQAREEGRRVDTFEPTTLPETGFDHDRIVAAAVSLDRGEEDSFGDEF